MKKGEKDTLQINLGERIMQIKNQKWFPLLFSLGALAIIVLLFGILTGGRFFTRNVMLGIFQQSIIVGIMAVGVSLIYSTGDVDISVGNAMGLAATVGALSYQIWPDARVMIIVTIVCAILLMLFNCTLSVIFNVKPAMVAIAAMTLYSAITIEVVGADTIKVDYQMCRGLEGSFRYISFAIYFIVMVFMFHATAVGRRLRFIGGNEECSRQAGINAKKTRLLSYFYTGIGVGLAGVYTITRSGSVANSIGSGMGMDVMLATVLGGMSIFGGARSNVYSGLIGAMTVTALNKGLLMVGIPTAVIQGVRAVVFLLLVFLNSERPNTLPVKEQF